MDAFSIHILSAPMFSLVPLSLRKSSEFSHDTSFFFYASSFSHKIGLIMFLCVSVVTTSSFGWAWVLHILFIIIIIIIMGAEHDRTPTLV